MLVLHLWIFCYLYIFIAIPQNPFSELRLQLQSSFENEESSPETEQPTEADSETTATPITKNKEECGISQSSEEDHTKCNNLPSELISSHSSLAKELSELRLESRRYWNLCSNLSVYCI